jgi:thiamine biosynthesis protein ThiS|tara:strand:+ start:285 stop:503 length:219 start_codon:yes stop_codon:yes gene_type:complete
MKKIKKIKIRLNGKNKNIINGYKLYDLIKELDLPLQKVAIELNKKIVDKKKVKNIKLKDKDNIEIVHFIGGG